MNKNLMPEPVSGTCTSTSKNSCGVSRALSLTMCKFCIIASFIFFTGAPLVSGGKADTLPPANKASPSAMHWTITSPSVTLPGDCLVVRFTSDAPLVDAAVILTTASGKTIAKTTAFPAQQTQAVATAQPGIPAAGVLAAPEQMAAPAGSPDAPKNTASATLAAETGSAKRIFSYIALTGLSSTLEPGEYTISASALRDGKTVFSVTPLHIGLRSFFCEEVALDNSNTAIKTNTGHERITQIEKLNEILFRSDPAAPRFTGPFAPPLQSKRRTAEYGDRRKYLYSNGSSEQDIHYGIDFGVPKGTPVFAAGDGLVVMAEKRVSTGWSVVIEHLPGVYSLYYHMDTLATAEGEFVRTGTLIGHSGATGLATGPHLHWEFRVNGEAVSPDWFAGRTLY